MKETSYEPFREYAKNLILEVYESVDFLELNSEFKHFTSELEFVRKIENIDGEIEFCYSFSSGLGKITMCYSPQPFVEKFLKGLKELAIAEENSNGTPAEVVEYIDQENFKIVVKILLLNMLSESLDFVSSQPILALETAEIIRGIKKFGAKNQERINQVIEILNKDRKDRITKLTKQFSKNCFPPQYIFCDVYETHKKEWESAKSCYKQNQKYADAIKMVKVAFPHLPEDLVEKFSDNDKEISRPSNLALESTSRHLNTPNKVVGRSLQRYLQDSRKQRQKVSDKQAEATYNAYINSLESDNHFNDKLKKIYQQSLDGSLLKHK